MAEKPRKSRRGPQIIPLPTQRSGAKSAGEALRQKYQGILEEPIPDRLQKMIEALREAERKEEEGD